MKNSIIKVYNYHPPLANTQVIEVNLQGQKLIRIPDERSAHAQATALLLQSAGVTILVKNSVRTGERKKLSPSELHKLSVSLTNKNA